MTAHCVSVDERKPNIKPNSPPPEGLGNAEWRPPQVTRTPVHTEMVMVTQADLNAALRKEAELWPDAQAKLRSGKRLRPNHPWVLAAQAYCELVRRFAYRDPTRTERGVQSGC